jgi:hypothetical protein
MDFNDTSPSLRTVVYLCRRYSSNKVFCLAGGLLVVMSPLFRQADFVSIVKDVVVILCGLGVKLESPNVENKNSCQ